MIAVYLLTFAKNTNSTARPALDDSMLIEGELIENTSILAPSIAFRFDDTVDPPTGKNYIVIPIFQNRHYFINDWVYELGLWRANCTVDALATWKTQLGNSTQYVTRSAEDYDGSLTDGAYPMKTTPIIRQQTAYGPGATVTRQYSPFDSSLGSGSYVVGIQNNSTGSVGSTAYYAFNSTQFRNLCAYLYGDSFINTLNLPATEISQQLAKAMFNPLQYITNVQFFPFPVDEFVGTAVTSLPYGYWSIPVSAKLISGTSYGLYFWMTFDELPVHPQAATRGSYLRQSPYTNVVFNWPAFGQFEIPNSMLYATNTITLDIMVDVPTGQAKFRFHEGTRYYNSASKHIEMTFQVGVPISISQLSRDYIGKAGNLISSVASIFTGGAIGAALGTASSVNSVTDVVKGELNTISENGAISGFVFIPSLIFTFYEIADEYRERIGRPLCKPVQIKTLSGYIKCERTEMHVAGTDEEMRMLEEIMDGGFYYA